MTLVSCESPQLEFEIDFEIIKLSSRQSSKSLLVKITFQTVSQRGSVVSRHANALPPVQIVWINRTISAPHRRIQINDQHFAENTNICENNLKSSSSGKAHEEAKKKKNLRRAIFFARSRNNNRKSFILRENERKSFSARKEEEEGKKQQQQLVTEFGKCRNDELPSRIEWRRTIAETKVMRFDINNISFSIPSSCRHAIQKEEEEKVEKPVYLCLWDSVWAVCEECERIAVSVFVPFRKCFKQFEFDNCVTLAIAIRT